jgi:choline dehydrogenase
MLDAHRTTGRRDVASRFDYVIVGAGSAGCVVARRLVEGTEATVLVLEAGGPDEGAASIANPPQWVENIGSRFDWAYTYAPSPHLDNRSLPLPRGKVLGGCGSINAMIWTRGNRADYDGWSQVGNAGWDFESVLPLFKASEDWEDGANAFRGAGGPIRVERVRDLDPVSTALIDAGRSCGMPYLHDINIPDPEGVGPLNRNIRDGRRCSPADAFLKPAMSNESLTVLTGAQTVRLRLRGTRCVGVDVLIDGRPYSIDASREVILCAGAIDTPRLLMLSGIGPHPELKQLGIATIVDLPGVGRNLQDHVLVAGLCFQAKQPLPRTNNNLSSSAAFWKSRPDLDVPDLMLVSTQVPVLSDEIRARYPIPDEAFCVVLGLVQPRSRGFVRMKTAKHDGQLEIQPNFLAEQADVDALVSGIGLGLDITSRPAFRKLIERRVAPVRGLSLSREETVTFLRRSCTSYFHPVGTCAMGSGREAVVDAELRVRGVDGLRIADASIMPTITSANTNAPCVMIGEFVARRIMAAESTNHQSRPAAGSFAIEALEDRLRGAVGGARS